MHNTIIEESGIDFKSNRIKQALRTMLMWEINGCKEETYLPDLPVDSVADEIINLYFQNNNNESFEKLKVLKNRLQASWEELLLMVCDDEIRKVL